MKDLKLAIYESEALGVISESTRDELLEVLEATRYDKEAEKALEKHRELAKKNEKLINKIEEILDDDESISTNMRKKYEEKIRKLKFEIDDSKRELHEKYGKKVITNGYNIYKIDNSDNALKDESFKTSLGLGRNQEIESGKEIKGRENKPKPAKQRKPGMFAKESVNELKLSIYEKCAYGEISESERDVLLESLEDKLF